MISIISSDLSNVEKEENDDDRFVNVLHELDEDMDRLATISAWICVYRCIVNRSSKSASCT